MTEPVKVMIEKSQADLVVLALSHLALKRPGWNEMLKDLAQHFDPLVTSYEDFRKWGASERPKVICLCGSTRFTTEMMVMSWELSKQGHIAIGWNALPDDYFAQEGLGESNVAEFEGVKEQIDELHKRKIDLADQVLVLNIEGYIGESTRSEIDYAIQQGKAVVYLEPVDAKE